jgi:hypothetical protein
MEWMWGIFEIEIIFSLHESKFSNSPPYHIENNVSDVNEDKVFPIAEFISGFDKKHTLHTQYAMLHQFSSHRQSWGGARGMRECFCESINPWLNFIMNASRCETKKKVLENEEWRRRSWGENYFNGKTFAQNHHKNGKFSIKLWNIFISSQYSDFWS